jgi:peptidoglycan/LPS O-acetylase OafA/YrhL
MPVVWTYLLLVTLTAVLLHRAFALHLCGSLLFFRNFLPMSGEYMSAKTGHFWSLSIEEQFYLVWPVALLILGGRALWGAIAGFVLDAGFMFWDGAAHGWPTLGIGTQNHVHALLAGCILALAWQQERFRQLLSRRWLLLASSTAWAASVLLSFPYKPVQTLLIAVMLGSSIAWDVPILSSKPLRGLGVISYSVYVWHGFGILFGWVGIALIPVVGYASYALLERPGIRLGARLAPRMTRQTQFQSVTLPTG